VGRFQHRACTARFGTLIALMEKKRSGKGQIVKGSAARQRADAQQRDADRAGVLGVNRKPTGNRGQTAAPDRPLSHDRRLDPVPGDRQAALRSAGRSSWASPSGLTDRAFHDDISRGDNGPVISERMQRWCATRTSAEVIETLGKASIPAGRCCRRSRPSSPPCRVAAMEILAAADFPGLPKPAPVAVPPIFLSETARVPRTHCAGARREYRRDPRRARYAKGDIAALARTRRDLDPGISTQINSAPAKPERGADRERDSPARALPRPSPDSSVPATPPSPSRQTRIERLPLARRARRRNIRMHRRDRGSVITRRT
jgi:crotonobetainyl-CoA:carnitine CoA-transferase CaiB-like acyl-CoA transferase